MEIWKGWLTPGWDSTVADAPQLADIHRCIMDTRLHRPVSIELTVHGPEDKDAIIAVVPTALRTVFLLPQYEAEQALRYEDPEYEFEGWVVIPPTLGNQRPVWVRGSLHTTEDDEMMNTLKVFECTIWVLDPGTELGTNSSAVPLQDEHNPT